MTTPYAHLDLSAHTLTVPPGGILSQTLYNGESLKVVLFSFAEGQELSEHTASVPAVIHILQGEARLTLSGNEIEAKPGTWVYMPARLSHRVLAITPLVMLLEMLKTG
jgi:quercetin dioxygenase-like cupin family protein